MTLNKLDRMTVQYAMLALIQEATSYGIREEQRISSPLRWSQKAPAGRAVHEDVNAKYAENSAEMEHEKKSMIEMVQHIDWMGASSDEIKQVALALMDRVKDLSWHAPKGGTGEALVRFQRILNRTAVRLTEESKPVSRPQIHMGPAFETHNAHTEVATPAASSRDSMSSTGTRRPGSSIQGSVGDDDQDEAPIRRPMKKNPGSPQGQ